MYMLKVCILTSVHRPFDMRIFHKQAKSLVKAGYEVVLIVPHERSEVVEGIKIRAVPKPNNRVERLFLTTLLILLRSLKERARLYHFHDPELIPVGIFLKCLRKKVIYDVHEDYETQMLYKHYLPRWLRHIVGWIIGCLEEFTCRYFFSVAVPTPAIAERFSLLNPETVMIRNYPLPDELFWVEEAVSWGERELTVAYVGMITAVRGIYEMVESMGLLPLELHARLKLAGRFVPSTLREDVAVKSGWARVEELGFLDRFGVARLLSQVQAGLVVFHPEPNHINARPTKLFEYLSAGIPVIASDFPLWRKIVDESDCGLLVDPLNPWAIAEAIEYLLVHPDEANAMGKRGREAVKKRYNWWREESKLLLLYKGLWL